jgi:hypothetical protein
MSEIEKGENGRGEVVLRNDIGRWITVPILLLVAVSMFSIVCDWGWYVKLSTQVPKSAKAAPEKYVNVLDVIIYGLWTIGPPAWFFWEYTRKFLKKVLPSTPQMEDIKYTQELAGKFWAGVLLLLSALLFLKYGEKFGG